MMKKIKRINNNTIKSGITEVTLSAMIGSAILVIQSWLKVGNFHDIPDSYLTAFFTALIPFILRIWQKSKEKKMLKYGVIK